jgi:hypothetical protein
VADGAEGQLDVVFASGTSRFVRAQLAAFARYFTAELKVRARTQKPT